MDNEALKTKVSSLLADMVSIPSVNPGEESSQSIHLEKKMADYVKQFFECATYPYEIICEEVLPGRPNVIVKTGKNSQKKTLLLESHLDTVDVKDMTIAPFTPVIKNGRMYGRGACDAKAQLAAMITGLDMAVQKTNGHLPINVVFAATCDEEHLHRGVDELIRQRFSADGAVVGEPTEMKLVAATKGSIRFQVCTSGRSAHSSKPHDGVNAIYIMAEIIHVISNVVTGRVEGRKHPLCGLASVAVTIVDGGSQVNIIPDHCTIDVDRRLLPGETWEDAYQEIKELILEHIEPKWHDFIEFKHPYLIDPSLETDVNSELVQVFRQVLSAKGTDDQVFGVPFGTDASKIAKLNIPTIVFGPGSINQAHTKDEYIEVNEVLQAAEIYRDLILQF